MTNDTLLSRRDEARRARRLELREEVRRDLRAALQELISGHRVWIFGSLTKPGQFNDASDVDMAMESEPEGIGLGVLSSELAERLGRPVDVVLLDRCRFRDAILREGELWTL